MADDSVVQASEHSYNSVDPSPLAKHGLDFAEFEDGFDLQGCTVQEARVSPTGRSRFKLIGAFRGQIVTAAIICPLGSEALSIVSFHRSNPSKVRLHERF